LLTSDALSKTVAPILIAMSKDPVGNVRMNVAKALKIITPLMKDKTGDVIIFILILKIIDL
jgi:hypothetical protein